MKHSHVYTSTSAQSAKLWCTNECYRSI